MIIDAHQHFWKYDKEKHAWIDDSMSQLKKDYLPKELKKVYQENGIEGCIAVQAEQSILETDFLLRLASENDFIKGIVGWVDLRSEKVEEQLRHYSRFEVIKGFRHVVQDEKDPKFLLKEDFKKGISLLGGYGFRYDLLIFPHQLESAVELVAEFPHQRFVIDHIAKPNIKNGMDHDWKALIHLIGKSEHVYCKLSGMVTEADWNDWRVDDFVPFMDVIFDAFGPDRIMFGSDWPVCLLSASYPKVKGIVEAYLSKLDEKVRDKVMGKNAIAFYNL